MEKRVLVAIFLSFLVLYIYQALVVKPVPKPAATSTASAPAGAPGEPAGDRPALSQSPPATAPTAPTAPSAAAVAAAATPVSSATALVTAPGERDVTVQTDDLIAVLTNRGGRLKS